MEAILKFDAGILNFIRAHLTNPFMDGLMKFITLFGEAGIFWIVVTLALIAIPKTRRLGLCAAVSLLLEFLCCNVVLKPLIHRTRPYILWDVTIIVERLSDYSFPSGHTGASFAVATALCFAGSRKLGIPALILSFLIAFSRLYLYVHYPTDVLAAMVLGTLTGLVGILVIRGLERKFPALRDKSEGSGGDAQ